METSVSSLTCFPSYLNENLKLNQVDLRTLSPLALAYIGDGIYEILIRTKVISRGSTQVNNMHKKGASLVKAGTQAEIIQKLLEARLLTQEEETVYKRGRNAKSVTMAKHATMAEYRKATGFEALCGYLYLSGQMERLSWLVGKGLMEIGELE